MGVFVSALTILYQKFCDSIRILAKYIVMNIKYLGIFLCSLVILSTNGIGANFVTNLTSGQLVFVRMVMGSVILLGAMLLSRQKFTFPVHRRSFVFQVLAGISNGLNYLFMFESYRLIGVSMTVIIEYTAPAIIMMLSPLIFKEKLSQSKILGFLIVLCGFLLINGQFNSMQMSGEGICCAAMSCISYVFVVILNKLARDLPGLEKSFLQILTSTIMVFIYLAATSSLSFTIERIDILPILYLGIVVAGLGSFLYYSTLPHLSAQIISEFSYIQPVATITLSFIILHEELTRVQLAGAVLIIGGALFAEIAHAQKKAIINEDKVEAR